jgi:hypothetical protein
VFGVLTKGVGMAVLLTAIAATVTADPLPTVDVRASMARVETLLADLHIDVAGYAQSDTPAAELAPPSHPYLQGNDGGFADGRIYINDEAIAGCRDLTLVHELVHDASVKYRLFPTVPNESVRDVFEALADAVTAIAAEDPYLPGCLPDRRFRTAPSELAGLAGPPHTP